MVVSCEVVGRSGMGVETRAGADLEARRVEQVSERIWPLIKSAVKTVRGRERLVRVGEGRGEWRLLGRRSGCERLVSLGFESRSGSRSRLSRSMTCQFDGLLLRSCRSVMASCDAS